MTYVYVVYIPGETIQPCGAWENYEEAKRWTENDFADGCAPKDADPKRYRIAQVAFVAR